jgi:hypothetical protein
MAKVTITITDESDFTVKVACNVDDGPDDDSATLAMTLSHDLRQVIFSIAEAHGGSVVSVGVGREPKPGDRVGAMRNKTSDTAYLYGFGVYEGEFVPGEDDGPQPQGDTADLVKRVESKNPRIRLDNGQVVWGCECWWGPEKAIQEEIEGLKIVRCNISEDRVACQHN